HAALAARCAVARSRVALLAAVDDAVAAELLRAARRAAVARRRVAVVAALAELARPVAAHRADARREGVVPRDDRGRDDARGAENRGRRLAVEELNLAAARAHGATDGGLSARHEGDHALRPGRLHERGRARRLRDV